ncbi:hypothetical protein ABGN05_15875 [Aquibium sp. LZ166]|uniref:DUF1127 domain-containing protein n=1 Tax=Aquibium pacificus TaxID=3153579 RepID=A0ABV3SK42_9HYPH
MSIIGTIGHLAREYRQRREIARTERMIGAMPAELRKDIGWPDSFTAQIGRPVSHDWSRH